MLSIVGDLPGAPGSKHGLRQQCSATSAEHLLKTHVRIKTESGDVFNMAVWEEAQIKGPGTPGSLFGGTDMEFRFR